MKKHIHFLPRILSILFIVFISLFALDVFEEPQWLLALIIHLIPSYILIILTIIAWKKPRIGGILFLITGLILLGISRSLVIATPALFIGILFLIQKPD